MLRNIHDYYPIQNIYRKRTEYLPAWNLDIPLPDITFGREPCNWSLIDNGDTVDEETRYQLRCQRCVPKHINGIKTLFDEKLSYKRSGNRHYRYVDWFMYLMRNVFHPNEDHLYGDIAWLGAESENFGRIVVSNDFTWGERLEEPKNDIVVYSYSTDGLSQTIPKGGTYYNVDNNWKYPPDL